MISYTLTKEEDKFKLNEGIDNESLNFALLSLADRPDNYLESCSLVAVNSNKYVHGVGKYKDVIFGDKYNIFVVPDETLVKFVGITGAQISFKFSNGVLSEIKE